MDRVLKGKETRSKRVNIKGSIGRISGRYDS